MKAVIGIYRVTAGVCRLPMRMIDSNNKNETKFVGSYHECKREHIL